jgi:3-keto-disaccharide hydrolase
MKLIFSSLFIAIVACSCNSSKKTTSNNAETNQMSNDQQWQSLFDGKTTKGWHKYGGGAVGAAWKVADGNLYLDTTAKKDWQIDNGGDIVTDEEFENFDFKLEWKIAKNGNSGIMFNVHEAKEYTYPWNTGPEMQVLDNDGHADGKIHKHRAGDLYDMIACSKETVKPVGEWNQVEIKSLNGKLDFYLNGTNVVSTTMWDQNWKDLIAGSKFNSMPNFGTYKKGRIALQDHGNTVWFRNIMIKKL